MTRPQLRLPGQHAVVTRDCPGNVTIFGANGSGKSRLGAWMEKSAGYVEFVHRISAQRALAIPDFVPVKTLEESLNAVMWGNSDPRYASNSYKEGHRWGAEILNDYVQVLSALFASEAERNRQYVDQSRLAMTDAHQPVLQIPNSEIDVLRSIWDVVMPQRNVELKDGQVKALTLDGEAYAGKDMSDGEKVVLYLIAQSLLARPNSVLVIDEPELHLHRSLMSRLWNSIERLRPDCLFVFITHDLDFAASRVASVKVWVRSYVEPKRWDWGFAESVDGMPDDILLEVLGTRRPTLFVEGERNSLDTAIFQAVYPEYHVIGRGSCGAVIRSTAGVASTNDVVHKAVGIIDRDARAEAEIATFASRRIHVLPVAEVENLLCCEPILTFLIAHLRLPAPSTLDAIKQRVLGWFSDELENQIALRVSGELRSRLSRFSASDRSPAGLEAEVSLFVSTINASTIWSDIEHVMRQVVVSVNYGDCLKYFNRKSLPRRIAPLLGLQTGALQSLVLNLLGSADNRGIVDALTQCCPAASILNVSLQDSFDGSIGTADSDVELS